MEGIERQTFKEDHRCSEMGPAIKDGTLRKESSGRNTFLEVLLVV